MLVRLQGWMFSEWLMNRQQLLWLMEWRKEKTRCEERLSSVHVLLYMWFTHVSLFLSTSPSSLLSPPSLPTLHSAALLFMILEVVRLISPCWRYRRECSKWSPLMETHFWEERTLIMHSSNTWFQNSNEMWVMKQLPNALLTSVLHFSSFFCCPIYFFLAHSLCFLFFRL